MLNLTEDGQLSQQACSPLFSIVNLLKSLDRKVLCKWLVLALHDLTVGPRAHGLLPLPLIVRQLEVLVEASEI